MDHFSETQGLLKDFQAPILLSSTFKAFKSGKLNSRTFKDSHGPVATLFPGQKKSRTIPGHFTTFEIPVHFQDVLKFQDAVGTLLTACLMPTPLF
jgi:hypothetical protein